MQREGRPHEEGPCITAKPSVVTFTRRGEREAGGEKEGGDEGGREGDEGSLLSSWSSCPYASDLQAAGKAQLLGHGRGTCPLWSLLPRASCRLQ